MTDNPLTLASEAFELNQINEFMEDDRVEKALLKLTSILANPEVNPSKVSKHIVECQALSAYFAIKATFYAGIGKNEPEAARKKNIYYTMKENFDLLAQSLKYIAKGGF